MKRYLEHKKLLILLWLAGMWCRPYINWLKRKNHTFETAWKDATRNMSINGVSNFIEHVAFSYHYSRKHFRPVKQFARRKLLVMIKHKKDTNARAFAGINLSPLEREILEEVK